MKRINLHTNPADLKFLRMKAIPVLGVTNDIYQTIQDLAETVAENKDCVGLSANQIWNDLFIPPPAVFVMRMQNGIAPFINPTVIKTFKKVEIRNEGCMSVPGKICPVERPKHIVVSFMNSDGETLANQHIYYDAARMWLHEYDHLQGKIILDYE